MKLCSSAARGYHPRPGFLLAPDHGDELVIPFPAAGALLPDARFVKFSARCHEDGLRGPRLRLITGSRCTPANCVLLASWDSAGRPPPSRFSSAAPVPRNWDWINDTWLCMLITWAPLGQDSSAWQGYSVCAWDRFCYCSVQWRTRDLIFGGAEVNGLKYF